MQNPGTLTEKPFLFYAVTSTRLHPLPVPPGTADFAGLLRGLPVGAYSALCTFSHNQFLYLNAHLDRLAQTMRLLGWREPLERAALCAALDAAATAAPWPDARVRFDVLARPAPAQLGTDSRMLIALTPLPPVPAALYETGVAVGLADGLVRHNPLAKTAEFAQRRAAFLADRSDDVYEYLLQDDNGCLLEGTGTNFWAVRAGTLYTAGTGVLEGITRRILLQLAAELGIPVRLEAVRHADVGALDEAALSGSSRALLPVVRIAGQVVGNGRPGPISRRLLAAYNAFVAREIRPATAAV